MSSEIVEYDLFEHRHRFSMWAACRAAQRGLRGGNVSVLCRAIKEGRLRELVANPSTWPTNGAAFDELHREIARTMIASMKQDGLSELSASYGRAAKLIAVYLKSMVVIGPDTGSDFAKIIHPP